MENLILVALLIVILGAAVIYIIKEKKRGVKCIGCPAAGTCASQQRGKSPCSGNCSGCSGCSGGCSAKSEGCCHGHTDED